MAKAKLCAYHLCSLPLETDDPKRIYCDIQCKRNAKQWRWRHRKPAKRAAQQHRWWLRKQAEGIKETVSKRRRPLATKAAKKAAEDGRETPTDQVA